MDIRAIITDIEGTTTPISFVKDTLFPYSYKKLEDFLRQNWEKPEVQMIVSDVQNIQQKQLSFDEVVQTLRTWIEEDRKITPLKQLQGMIWEEGYRSGELKGFVYEDAFRKLKQWHDKGIKLYVYSSGSVQAQKLLFAHTNYGDLTYLFSGYFDTTTGSKLEKSSYEKISLHIGLEPSNILFLSDNPQEVQAAAEAGMAVYRLVREGDASYIDDFPYPQVESFDLIEV